MKEKEPSSELITAFQSLTFLNAKTETNQTNNFAASLLQFVHYASEVNELPTYLVLLKLLLCLWEGNTSVDYTSVGNEALREACRKLATHSVLDCCDLRRLCANEEYNEQAQTFQSTPRVLLTSGHPTKLATFEVQGKAVGLIAGVQISNVATPVYFETTLKGRGFNGVRVGWALGGADLSNCTNHAQALGSTDEEWVLEVHSGYFFHHAAAVSRSRKELDGLTSPSEDACDDAEDDSLFANLFNEEDSDAGEPRRDSNVSADSAVEEQLSLLSHLSSMYGDRPESDNQSQEDRNTQTFLEMMREEDHGDLSSIRRLLMARNMVNSVSRSTSAGFSFRGSAASTDSVLARPASASGSARTQLGAVSAAATVASSEASGRSNSSTASATVSAGLVGDRAVSK